MDWKVRAVRQFLWLGIILLAIRYGAAEQRVVCYYTNWSVYRPGTAKFSPQNINPYLCTHLIYAFGGFTKDNALKPFDKYQDIEKGGYAKFNGLKTYNKNLKTMLAIGGWNEGSSRFSPMVADPKRRKEFVKNAVKFLRQNHFDGLDLDWEYPAFRDGGKARDKENYANLVQELREEFERESSKTGRPRLLLSMAIPAGIEYIDKGYDIPRLNEYLDFFNLLSYDYHSAFEPAVNHHSPLYPLEEESEYNYDGELTIDFTINHLFKKGASSDKIVLGIPTYGRSYTLYNEEATEIGSPADGPGEEGDATREKGYLAYYEICESVMNSDDWEVVQPNPNAMGPYAYKGNQWVGYDDEEIVRQKARYVNEKNLGGIMFWSIDNDDFRGKCHDRPYPLIEAAKETMLSGNEKTQSAQKGKTADGRKKIRTQGVQGNLVGRKVPSGEGRRTTNLSPVLKNRPLFTKPRNKPGTRLKSNENEKQSVNPLDANEGEDDSRFTNNAVRSLESADDKPKKNKPRGKNRRRPGSQGERKRLRNQNAEQASQESDSEVSSSNKLTTPEPPTTPDPGSDFKCEDEGFFSHPRDCKKYFWCLDSGPGGLGIVAHQFTCPSGLVFNKAADSCDYPRNVICPKSKTSSGSVVSTTRAPITAATSRTTYLYSTTQRTTTSTSDSIEDEEYYDDDDDDDEEEEEEDEPVSTTTARTLLYKTISRTRPTTTSTTTSTTTTINPISTTKSYQSLPERNRATQSQNINEDDPEEDPRVIKELIDLIKKAGGIEQLEKQLLLQEKNLNSGTTSPSGNVTPATISRSLYERVLNRQSSKGVNKLLGSPSTISTFSTTTPSIAVKDEEETESRSRTNFRNGPGRSQFEGLDDLPEVKSLRRAKKPQYVTIERQRPSTRAPDSEEETETDVEEEEDSENVASSEEKAISNPPEVTERPQRVTPSYVNIRRTRPTTAKSENDVEEKVEDASDLRPNFRRRRPTVSKTTEDAADDAIRTNFRNRRPTTQRNEPENDNDDEGNVEEDDDGKRKKLEEDQNVRTIAVQDETPTTKSRYTSINRFRSTTVAPSENPSSESIPISESTVEIVEKITAMSPITEPVTEEATSESPVFLTTTTTTTTTETPTTTPISISSSEASTVIIQEPPRETTLLPEFFSITKNPENEATVKLVEESATEILLTTAEVSNTSNQDASSYEPLTKETTAAVSQPRPFGFPRRTRPTVSISVTPSTEATTPIVPVTQVGQKVSTPTQNFARSSNAYEVRGRGRPRFTILNKTAHRDSGDLDERNERATTRPINYYEDDGDNKDEDEDQNNNEKVSRSRVGVRFRGSSRYTPPTITPSVEDISLNSIIKSRSGRPSDTTATTTSTTISAFTTESSRRRFRRPLRPTPETVSEVTPINVIEDSPIVRITQNSLRNEFSKVYRRKQNKDEDNLNNTDNNDSITNIRIIPRAKPLNRELYGRTRPTKSPKTRIEESDIDILDGTANDTLTTIPEESQPSSTPFYLYTTTDTTITTSYDLDNTTTDTTATIIDSIDTTYKENTIGYTTSSNTEAQNVPSTTSVYSSSATTGSLPDITTSFNINYASTESSSSTDPTIETVQEQTTYSSLVPDNKTSIKSIIRENNDENITTRGPLRPLRKKILRSRRPVTAEVSSSFPTTEEDNNSGRPLGNRRRKLIRRLRPVSQSPTSTETNVNDGVRQYRLRLFTRSTTVKSTTRERVSPEEQDSEASKIKDDIESVTEPTFLIEENVIHSNVPEITLMISTESSTEQVSTIVSNYTEGDTTTVTFPSMPDEDVTSSATDNIINDNFATTENILVTTTLPDNEQTIESGTESIESYETSSTTPTELSTTSSTATILTTNRNFEKTDSTEGIEQIDKFSRRFRTTTPLTSVTTGSDESLLVRKKFIRRRPLRPVENNSVKQSTRILPTFTRGQTLAKQSTGQDLLSNRRKNLFTRRQPVSSTATTRLQLDNDDQDNINSYDDEDEIENVEESNDTEKHVSFDVVTKEVPEQIDYDTSLSKDGIATGSNIDDFWRHYTTIATTAKLTSTQLPPELRPTFKVPESLRERFLSRSEEYLKTVLQEPAKDDLVEEGQENKEDEVIKESEKPITITNYRRPKARSKFHIPQSLKNDKSSTAQDVTTEVTGKFNIPYIPDRSSTEENEITRVSPDFRKPFGFNRSTPQAAREEATSEEEDNNENYEETEKEHRRLPIFSLARNSTRKENKPIYPVVSNKSRSYPKRPNASTESTVTETLVPAKKFDYAADAVHRKQSYKTSTVRNSADDTLDNENFLDENEYSATTLKPVTRLVTSVTESGTTERQKILIKTKYSSLTSTTKIPVQNVHGRYEYSTTPSRPDASSTDRSWDTSLAESGELLNEIRTRDSTEKNPERSTLPIESEFAERRGRLLGIPGTFTTETTGESSTIEIESFFSNVISGSKTRPVASDSFRLPTLKELVGYRTVDTREYTTSAPTTSIYPYDIDQEPNTTTPSDFEKSEHLQDPKDPQENLIEKRSSHNSSNPDPETTTNFTTESSPLPSTTMTMLTTMTTTTTSAPPILKNNNLNVRYVKRIDVPVRILDESGNDPLTELILRVPEDKLDSAVLKSILRVEVINPLDQSERENKFRRRRPLPRAPSRTTSKTTSTATTVKPITVRGNRVIFPRTEFATRGFYVTRNLQRNTLSSSRTTKPSSTTELDTTEIPATTEATLTTSTSGNSVNELSTDSLENSETKTFVTSRMSTVIPETTVENNYSTVTNATFTRMPESLDEFTTPLVTTINFSSSVPTSTDRTMKTTYSRDATTLMHTRVTETDTVGINSTQTVSMIYDSEMKTVENEFVMEEHRTTVPISDTETSFLQATDTKTERNPTTFYQTDPFTISREGDTTFIEKIDTKTEKNPTTVSLQTDPYTIVSENDRSFLGNVDDKAEEITKIIETDPYTTTAQSDSDLATERTSLFNNIVTTDGVTTRSSAETAAIFNEVEEEEQRISPKKHTRSTTELSPTVISTTESAPFDINTTIELVQSSIDTSKESIESGISTTESIQFDTKTRSIESDDITTKEFLQSSNEMTTISVPTSIHTTTESVQLNVEATTGRPVQFNVETVEVFVPSSINPTTESIYSSIDTTTESLEPRIDTTTESAQATTKVVQESANVTNIKSNEIEQNTNFSRSGTQSFIRRRVINRTTDKVDEDRLHVNPNGIKRRVIFQSRGRIETSTRTDDVQSSSVASVDTPDRKLKPRRRIVLKRMRLRTSGIAKQNDLPEENSKNNDGSVQVQDLEAQSNQKNTDREVNLFKNSAGGARRPGTLVRPSTTSRTFTRTSSLPDDVSDVIIRRRKFRPGDGGLQPTTKSIIRVTDSPKQNKDDTLVNADLEAEKDDQSSRAQEVAVTVTQPLLPSAPTATGRPPFRTALRRRISTTQAPRTVFVTTTSAGQPVVVRRRQRPVPYEKIVENLPSRPRQRPIIDYDYYEDEEERVIGKPKLSGKLFITGRGGIRCLDQGNFPHPSSCKKFITCARMVSGQVIGTEYTCPDKLSFDPVGGICNWSAGLGCKE